MEYFLPPNKDRKKPAMTIEQDSEGRDVLAEFFHNTQRFVSYCVSTLPSKSWEKQGPASIQAQDTHWAGDTDWSETIKLALNGWRNGWQSVDAQMHTIKDELRPIRPRVTIKRALFGHRPDVPRYCSGHPMNMRRSHRVRVNAPCVRLLISIGALSNVEPEAYINRGAAVCAYIDAIENAGISTEIVATSRAKGNSRDIVECRIMLKQAGQPLDIDGVAFFLGHPAVLRRLVFRWREREAFYKSFCHGYGRSQNPEEEEGVLMMPTLRAKDNDISAQEHYNNIKNAIEEQQTLYNPN